MDAGPSASRARRLPPHRVEAQFLNLNVGREVLPQLFQDLEALKGQILGPGCTGHSNLQNALVQVLGLAVLGNGGADAG